MPGRRRRLVLVAASLLAVTLAPLNAQPAAAATVHGAVDWNDIHQRIDGFGGSTAFGMADKVMAFPTAKRNQILDALFSTRTGAGLTIIRNQIPNIQPTPGGAFTFSQDAGQAAFVDAARLRSPDIRLMATSWSPPGWMKSNGHESYGGTVRPEHWPNYATYLSEYALRYQNRGTPLYVLSPANEPDAATNYPSAEWSGADLRDFTRDHVAPTFRARGVTAKYMIPENSYWNEDRALPSLADPAAAARVDVVAGHGYAQATDPLPFTASEAAGKAVWQTEMSTLGAAADPGIADAMVEADRIHSFLTQANVNAWNNWWLASDKPNTREALIDLRIGFLWKNYTINKRLYAMGNWSRWVRPGWVRIGATAGDIPVTAFREIATGKVAVVAINPRGSSQTINLRLNGMSLSSMTPYRTSATENLAALPAVSTSGGFLTHALPASSITTFVGRATTTSPLAATVGEAKAWTGESTRTSVRVVNGGTTPHSGSVTVAVPSGVTATPRSFRFGPLAPGASVDVPVKLTVAPGVTAGTTRVEAHASLSDGTGQVIGSNVLRIHRSTHTFVPNTAAEKLWLHDADGSQLDGAVEDGNARFCDLATTATYKIELPADVTGGTIDLDIGNSFKVETSTDNATWTTRLVQTPAVTDLSNRRYRSLDINTVREGGTVVYLRIGDSVPSDGWGGWLAHVRLNLTRP